MSGNPAVIAEFQARLQALKLRRAGVPYSSISVVIHEYHGVDRSPDSWRYLCRKSGCPASRRGHGSHFKAAA